MRLRPILALSFVLAWLPALGHALGLGEIKLKSGLNQPLVAEIELLQMRDLGPNEILPSLASTEDFDRAGVSRDFFLTDMRFEVKTRPDGSAFVLVTTRKPVREPFVNFLMEVLWPAGRLLREYTLLMDPPVYADKVSEAVDSPQSADASQSSQRGTRSSSAPRPEVQDPVTTVRADSQRPATSTRSPQGTQPATQPTPRPIAQQPVPRPVAPPKPQFEDPGQETYTTQENDALWNIATLLRPSTDVTVQQTMLAIQRKNPDAFVDNNINRMKTGKVLRAPSTDEVRELTREEAVAQVAEQERRWRQRLASRSGSTPEVEKPVLSDANNNPGYAPEGDGPGGRITLASADGDGSGESGAGGDEQAQNGGGSLPPEELENELDRVRSEKLEAESRIAELDALLTQNDSIISLQNEQIARLQQRLKELEQQANQGTTADPGVGNDGPKDENSPPQEFDRDRQPPESPGLKNTPIGNDIPNEEGDRGISQPEPEPKPDPVSEYNDTEGVVPAPPKSAFYENPIYIGVGVGAVIVAGLMFFIFRRREDDDEFDLLDDEELDDFDEDGDLLEADTEMPLSEVDDEFDGSGALDDQIGDPSDVISEADIFMAYGRFPEAVKLLQSAIDNDPNHPEVFLKLLEVYVDTKDAEGFVSCEAQIMNAPFYETVADRVSQLRQEYGGDLPPPAQGGHAAAASGSGADDDAFAGLDLSKTAGDDDIDTGKQAVSDEDFGLSPVDESESSDEQSASDLESLAYLESSLTADFGQDAADDQPTAAKQQDDLNLDLGDVHDANEADEFSSDLALDESEEFDPSALAADLDSALDEGGLDEPGEPKQAQASDDDVALPTADLDFSAPSVDDTMDDEAVNESSEDGADLADLAADLDLAFDDEPEQQPAAPTAPAANVPENDFMADADEAATKLDLARAYIDMGDRAGARDILDEVVQEGNEEQKQEAKALLKKVG